VGVVVPTQKFLGKRVQIVRFGESRSGTIAHKNKKDYGRHSVEARQKLVPFKKGTIFWTFLSVCTVFYYWFW
jgi:hypothetical protein